MTAVSTFNVFSILGDCDEHSFTVEKKKKNKKKGQTTSQGMSAHEITEAMNVLASSRCPKCRSKSLSYDWADDDWLKCRDCKYRFQ